jgi:hypothetical protein
MEIVDYPNYLIYPDGKVYSKYTKRYLRAGPDKKGYYRVNVSKGKKNYKTYKIHRLIAEHYIPNPENKKEVDHINRDRSDNRIENLRWADRSENTQNVGIRKDNKSGFKNIYYSNSKKGYIYRKKIRGKKYERYFKTLRDALVCKFVFCLLIKSRIISIDEC